MGDYWLRREGARPSDGLRQSSGVLCYAAAAATALNWATGFQYSEADCMHLYLMNESASADIPSAVAYRRQYRMASSMMPECGPAEIHALMNRSETGALTLREVRTREYGTPVFPPAVTVVYRRGSLTDSELIESINAGRPVMAAVQNHWMVVAGYEGTDSMIKDVHVWDPGAGIFVEKLWSGGSYFDEYYIVG